MLILFSSKAVMAAAASLTAFNFGRRMLPTATRQVFMYVKNLLGEFYLESIHSSVGIFNC
jgi:hypothetical protein